MSSRTPPGLRREATRRLAELVAERFAAHGGSPPVVAETFGEVQPQTIAEEVAEYCRKELRAPLRGAEFVTVVPICVFGLELRGGIRAVVKVRPPGASVAHLSAAQTVMSMLDREGFPCPAPLAPPVPLAWGIATAEALNDRGWVADAHDPPIRRSMAAELARLVELCRGAGGRLALRRSDHEGVGQLWPAASGSRHDLAARGYGAEWIDRIAHAALRARDGAAPLEEVVVHGDWCVEHLRFEDARVTAVYEWDSLELLREPVAVGAAAHGFTVDRSRPERRQFPDLDQALAFAREYEQARETAFTEVETRVLRAALVHSMAYSARCELAEASALRDRRAGAAHAGPLPPGGARAFLAQHSGELLGFDPGPVPAVGG